MLLDQCPPVDELTTFFLTSKTHQFKWVRVFVDSFVLISYFYGYRLSTLPSCVEAVESKYRLNPNFHGWNLHISLSWHLKSPQQIAIFLHFHGLTFHHFSTAPAKPLPGHPWVRCLIHTQTSLELVQHAVDALVGHDVGTQIHTVPGLLKMLCWRLGNHVKWC